MFFICLFLFGVAAARLAQIEGPGGLEQMRKACTFHPVMFECQRSFTIDPVKQYAQNLIVVSILIFFFKCWPLKARAYCLHLGPW